MAVTVGKLVNDDIRLPRVGKNLLNNGAIKANIIPINDFGTGSHSFPDEDTIEVVSGSAGRSFYSTGITLTVGKTYVFSIDVVSVTVGYPSTSKAIYFSSLTTSEGVTGIAHNELTPGRMAVMFTVATVTSPQLRFGIGSEGNVGGWTVRLRRPALYEIPDPSGYDSPMPYLPPSLRCPVPIDYEATYDETTKLLTETITPFPFDIQGCGILLGDSMNNDYGDTWAQVSDASRLGNTLMIPNGVSGRTMQTIASNIDTILGASSVEWRMFATTDVALDLPSWFPYPKFGVVMAGVNDLASASTASPLEAMQSAVQIIAARFKTVGIKHIAFCEVMPWGGAASFNHTTYDQQRTDAWNAWLSNWCANNGYGFVSLYSIMEDGTTADTLSAAYDSGDGLHPNATGYGVIADQIVKWIRTL